VFGCLFFFERLKLRFRVIIWICSLFFVSMRSGKSVPGSVGIVLVLNTVLAFFWWQSRSRSMTSGETNPSASKETRKLLDLPVAVVARSCGFAPPILTHSLGTTILPSNSFRNHSRSVYKAQGERPRHIPKPSIMAQAWSLPVCSSGCSHKAP
jgi:hypothetical protein